MNRGFQIVEFIMSFVERFVSLFWGMVLFHNFTIDNQDGGAIINVTIAVTKMRNITIGDWLGFTVRVSMLSQASGKFRCVHD